MNAVIDQAATLTAAEARRLTSDARNALALADDLLARLFAGAAWSALGHADWVAYCAAELPELRHLKMRATPRRARVAALQAAGASMREMAAATGASLGTIHGDVAALAGAQSRVSIAGTRTDRVVAALIAAGPAGLTVHQLARKERCHHGAASAALSRLAAAGRVRRLPAPRGVVSPYIVTESPA
jgi:hypothetical protein